VSIAKGEPSTKFNCASQKLLLCGITGTNGKTTINWLVTQALRMLGVKTARFGTLGTDAPPVLNEKDTLTTPAAPYFDHALEEIYQAGYQAAVLEVSSHGLVQKRVEYLAFDVAVFSNLTRDHLDYHKSFDNYFQAKAHLFELLAESPKKNKSAVINLGDHYGAILVERFSKQDNFKLVTFGREEGVTIQLLSESFTQYESQIVVRDNRSEKQYNLRSPLIGQHNAENLSASLLALEGMGIDIERCLEVLGEVSNVPGRLEAFHRSKISVFVDYAHSPDSLEKVILTLKPLTKGRLWVVFGCGGDRDRGKRPIMFQVALSHADKVVVTSDNPRTEDPQQIINDILSQGGEATFIELQREEAICRVIQLAEKGDVVLIAGKGHEDYQIIDNQKRYFSDQEVVKSALNC
jgi:UDP-N-acetylmuramoyl-L-alanyl-D-glutamate--2,6-diaminopimelate ligase